VREGAGPIMRAERGEGQKEKQAGAVFLTKSAENYSREGGRIVLRPRLAKIRKMTGVDRKNTQRKKKNIQAF